MNTTNYRKERLKLIKEIIKELTRYPVFAGLKIYSVDRDFGGSCEIDIHKTGYGLGIRSGWILRETKQRVVEIDCKDGEYDREGTLLIETFDEVVETETLNVIKSFQERIGRLFSQIHCNHYKIHISEFEQSVREHVQALSHLVSSR